MKKIWKARLQKLAGSLGYKIIKVRETVAPLDVFRDILAAHAPPTTPGFFFVQIGANDGISYDWIRPYVLRYGWRGVLVEPQPEPFSRLLANYAGVGGLSFVNVAIATTRGRHAFYCNQTDLIGGLREEVTRRNKLGGNVKKIEVDAITFADLLFEQQIARIDLLAIDTEGYDLEILKMIDFGRLRPRVIRYEICNMSDAEFQESENLLVRQGYRFFLTGSDAIAVLDTPEVGLSASS